MTVVKSLAPLLVFVLICAHLQISTGWLLPPKLEEKVADVNPFLQKVITGVKEGAQDHINEVKPIIKQTVEGVKETAQDHINEVKPIIKQTVEGVKETAQDHINEVKPIIKQTVEGVKETAQDHINEVKPIIKQTVEGVKETAQDHINEVKPIIKQTVEGVKETAQDHINEVKPIIKQIVEGVKEGAQDDINEVQPIIKQIVEGVKETAQDHINEVKPIIKQIVEGVKETAQDHINEVKPVIKQTVDGVKHSVQDGVNVAKEKAQANVKIAQPSFGLWFKKPIKKYTASFWSSSSKIFWRFEPKVDRLKNYLKETFSVTSFDALCPYNVPKLSSELKSMPNEWVSEIPEICYTPELLEMAQGLNFMKKSTMMSKFQKRFSSMTSVDKIKVIAQDLAMFSSNSKLINQLSEVEVFGICQQLNVANLPKYWPVKRKTIFGEKLSSRLESCTVDDVMATIKCASIQTEIVAKCLGTLTCEQMSPIQDTKLPTTLSNIVTKACTKNLDGNKLKVMPCAAVKQLSFGNFFGLKFSDLMANFKRLVKCHSTGSTPTNPSEDSKVSTKVAKNKKKKGTAERMKESASMSQKQKKKCPKLSARELVKKVPPKDLDKDAFFSLLVSELAGAIKPKEIREVDSDILCRTVDPSRAYSKLRNNARRAVKEKCKDIFDEGPLKDRGLTIIGMTKIELQRELEELGSEDDVIDAISEACAYSFQLPHKLLKVMVDKVKDMDLTIGNRLEDVACTLPKMKASDLKKFCDGNSNRLKLALGRSEVDFTKRPKKEGRLLGLCGDEQVTATPCEQGDLVTEYLESEVDTLSTDIITTEISCLDKVRSKRARKKIVEKLAKDPSGGDNCLPPETVTSMGSLLDDVDTEVLGKPCNKELLVDASVPYFKARADKKNRCNSLREKGNVDTYDEEDSCNDNNMDVANTVLAAVSEKEVSDAAPEVPDSRKKRSLFGKLVGFVFGMLTCDQIMMLRRDFSTVTVEKIKSLSPKDFDKCKEELGNYEYFDGEVRAALAEKGKQVFGEVSSWTEDETLPAFVAGLSSEEISELDLSSLEVIETLGDSPYFEDPLKSEILLTAWKKDTSFTTTAAMTPEQVIALGNGICSFKPGDLEMLSDDALREAAEKLGSLDCFSMEALNVLYKHVSTALGYVELDTVAVSTLGNLIAGANWTNLDASVFPAIELSPKTQLMIPASKWKSVSTEQASAFTYQQAISFMDDVLQYFEEDVLTIILTITGKEQITNESTPSVNGEENLHNGVEGQNVTESEFAKQEGVTDSEVNRLPPDGLPDNADMNPDKSERSTLPGYPDMNPDKNERPTLPDNPNINPDKNERPTLPDIRNMNPDKNERPTLPDNPNMNPDKNERPTLPDIRNMNPDKNERPTLPDIRNMNPDKNERPTLPDIRNMNPDKNERPTLPDIRNMNPDKNERPTLPDNPNMNPDTNERPALPGNPDTNRDEIRRPTADMSDNPDVMDITKSPIDNGDDKSDHHSIIRDNMDRMREELEKETRHFSLPFEIRSLGSVAELAKEQLKKITDTSLTSNFLAEISDYQVDPEVIISLATNVKTATQKAVLQAKARMTLPTDKDSAKGLLQWLPMRKLKQISDDILRDLRPNLQKMDWRQVVKTGRTIVKSAVQGFSTLATGEKVTKAVELMKTKLADSASREDRKKILENLGPFKLDSLIGLGLSEVTKMSSEFAKEYVKKLKNDSRMNCAHDDISLFTSKSPKTASLFLGAKCIAAASYSAVQKVAQGLDGFDLLLPDGEPENEKQAYLTPTARAITDRITEKPDKMEKAYAAPLIGSMFVKLLPASKMEEMPTEVVCVDNLSYNYALPSQKMLLFDKCRKSFGKIGRNNSAAYGALLSMAPIEEIEDIDVNVDDIWTTVETFCQQESELTYEQERVFYNKLENLLTKDTYKALKNADILHKSRCILKHIPERIVKSLNTSDMETICEKLAEGELSKIKTEDVEKFKTLCLETKIPMSKMGEMLKTLTVTELSGENDQILDSVEEMSREIISPDVRRVVYDKVCKGGNSSSIGLTKMALCGKLVGEFADLEELNIDDVVDMVEPIARQCEGARKKMKKCIRSGQRKTDCRQLHEGCKRFMKHIFKVIAKTSPTTRRRRSSRERRDQDGSCNPSITCMDIKMAGSEAVLLEAEMLGSLCKSHFDDCAVTLGRLPDFTTDQRDALLMTAIKHWGEPSSWTSEQLESAGVIVLSMTDSQLGSIAIDSLEAASSIGQHWEWVNHKEKLRHVFNNWFARTKSSNASSITSVDLQSLGHLVCGAETDLIDQIQHSAYADAAYQIGLVKSCGVQQLRSWAKKAIAAFGPVIQWSRSRVSDVGTIIGGLMESEIQQLTSSQIQAISYDIIDAIPAMCFAKFTATQLSYLMPMQAIHATDDQLASLSQEQRLALESKAREIRSQPIVQEDSKPDAGGAFVCASIWVLFTGVLAACLQI